MKNTIAGFFLIVSILFLLMSGVMGIFFGNSAIDIQLHDTYFVIATFHVFILLALVLATYSLLYFFIPKLIRRRLNVALSQLHFWTTVIAVILLLILLFFNSFSGVPTRYYSFEIEPSTRSINFFLAKFPYIVLMLVIVQLIFVLNVIYSMYRGPKIERKIEILN